MSLLRWCKWNLRDRNKSQQRQKSSVVFILMMGHMERSRYGKNSNSPNLLHLASDQWSEKVYEVPSLCVIAIMQILAAISTTNASAEMLNLDQQLQVEDPIFIQRIGVYVEYIQWILQYSLLVFLGEKENNCVGMLHLQAKCMEYCCTILKAKSVQVLQVHLHLPS